MIKAKTKTAAMQNCLRCAEEIRKADRSRKYAHELKNIFITISTVVNAEIESPHQYSSISNNTSMLVESGDASPFIMEGRKQRNQSKTNSSINVNNIDSPFFFLKTLCDYGKTLIKEINEMGKDYTDKGNNNVEPFNISKAIDFCVDMFDTKRKYDKSKKNLEFSSDINFSYDKMIKSISETGLKMVLINLLTNAYKFTIKGKIIVRAVSMPKEKKIRILVKDSGKGFDPNNLKKNGCFYIYERNQDLNVDGSGLGLTIVYEILTKFNIKLEIISNPEKGGSLFYFDLDDTYPYYDEINPQSLMTESLTQIIKDINSGKKDKEYFHNKKTTTTDFKINLYSMAKNQSKIVDDNNENEKNNNVSNSKKNINSNNNNLAINFNNNNMQRFSFMGEDYCSPTLYSNNKSIEEKPAQSNFQNSLQKNYLNVYNNNIKSNHSIFTFDKDSHKRKKNSVKIMDSYLNSNTLNSNINSNINNNSFFTPNKKRIDRFYSLQKQISISSNIKKEGKPNILRQILEINNHKNYKKLKTFNESGKKEKDNKAFIGKNNAKKSINFEDINNTLVENENQNIFTKSELEQIKKIKDNKKKNNNKNYRKLLNKNYDKTKFYIFELRKIFLKNEIYFNLSKNERKKYFTEPSSRNYSEKNLKPKKSYKKPPNEVYIIICDDEPFVAMSAKELITKYYIKKGKKPKIYFTQDGFECIYLTYKLSIIENKKVEYILMDLEMPYLNGIVTCNFIKNIKEINIPIFILSGDEPKDCEADGYCNKPLNEIDIINKLDK